MPSPRSPRIAQLALKRGALVAAANWPVVVVQFVADAIFTALLAVPVAGGAMLVVLTSGLAPGDVIRLGVRHAVPAVAAALLAHPVALAAFLAAVLLALLGGSLLMAFIKGGTMAILVASEHEAGPLEQPPLRAAAVRRASRFSLEHATTGAQRHFGRFARLGGVLFLAYAIVLGSTLTALVNGGSPESAWDAARIAALTAAVGTAVTVINLLYLLTQIAITVDDCDMSTALGRMGRLLCIQPVEIGIVFASTLSLLALGIAASLLATAALGLIAFVPFVGLAAVPLQVAAWVVRSFVFQYLGLTALVAYVQLYRRSREPGDGTPAVAAAGAGSATAVPGSPSSGTGGGSTRGANASSRPSTETASSRVPATVPPRRSRVSPATSPALAMASAGAPVAAS
jgi:hypothetical protein